MRVLSGRFPKHSQSCPQRGSLQDRLRKMRKHWRQAGCPDDVRRTMQTVCRRCPEIHFRIQILLWTKISTRKIRSLPKAPKRVEAFRGDKDSERNLSGICGQVAESCGFINFAFRILSGPCPGPSGRLVLGTNFSEILIGLQTFSFTKIHLKMSSAKWCPFCLGLNVLRVY